MNCHVRSAAILQKRSLEMVCSHTSCPASLELRDIDAVVAWSETNRLAFNASKCKSITFTRSKSPILVSYELAGSPLERLEYNSIVWDPQEKLYSVMIEKVQRKFARFIYKREYGYYPFLYPSIFVSGMVGLDTLELRRKHVHMLHYYFLLIGRIDNPSVRETIHFYVPDQYLRGSGRRRHRLLASSPSWRSPHGGNCPTGRAVPMLNDFLQRNLDADLFFDGVNIMSRHILRYLNNFN
ncbi:hypothetical protein HW555_001440 [Spodoptera exigua]|uniref:Uncharacterized protein n=1 Tax=Spodoptera exigua TaxID=7107 RepID=A0A835GT85_SPOEX|nr:hypothetical protein HW555_001440 [Spodoptera exigua]